MASHTMRDRTTRAADEAAIAAFHGQMIDAWNTGNGEAFAAPFTRNATFVAFEGTNLEGREQIAAFHQHIFESERSVKGSRLTGEVQFVRFLGPRLALITGECREPAA
jgi:uncharacterized protein (TIGR02246 family)